MKEKTISVLIVSWVLITAALIIYWFLILASGGFANRPRPALGVAFYVWYGAHWLSVLGVFVVLVAVCAAGWHNFWYNVRVRPWGWKKELMRCAVAFLVSLGLISVLGLGVRRLQAEALTARRLEREFQPLIAKLEADLFPEHKDEWDDWASRKFEEAHLEPPFLVIAGSVDGRNLRVDAGFVPPNYPVAESLDALNQILITINEPDVRFGSPARTVCLVFSPSLGPLPNNKFGMKRIVLGSKSWVWRGSREFSGRDTPVHERIEVIGGQTYKVQEYLPGHPGAVTARAAFADWLDSATLPRTTGRK
jgi:hypothetical protein